MDRHALTSHTYETMMEENGSVSKRIKTGNRQHPLGRAWWFVPKPFDLVSSALYIAVLLTYFLYDCPCLRGWLHDSLLVTSVLALLSIERVEYWLYGEEPPRGVAIALLALRCALIFLIAQLDHYNFSPFLFLIVPFLGCLYFGNLAGYSLALLAWLVYYLRVVSLNPQWYEKSMQVNNLMIYSLGLIFAITMARTVVNEQISRARAERLLTELEESHRQLKEYAGQVEELATTRERNRLARDIHDTLGHYLTVINVQLEKALAFRDKKPQEAERAVSDAKRLASEALHDVRRSVGALRTTQDIFALVPVMEELVRRVNSEQCSVELRVEGSEERASKQALLVLYRVAQEGLTNVQKHAAASRVLVDLQFGEAEVHLQVSDNGIGFDPSIVQQGHEGGYGLLGVQERLELVGGHMHIESALGDGTCLLVVIPLRTL